MFVLNGSLAVGYLLLLLLFVTEAAEITQMNETHSRKLLFMMSAKSSVIHQIRRKNGHIFLTRKCLFFIL